MSHSFFCRFAWHQLQNVVCKWTEILTHPTQKRGPTFILHIIAHFFEEKEPFRTFIQQSYHTIFTILNLENTRLLLLLSILRLSDQPFLFSFRFLWVVTCSASPSTNSMNIVMSEHTSYLPQGTINVPKRSHHCWQNMLICLFEKNREIYARRQKTFCGMNEANFVGVQKPA